MSDTPSTRLDRAAEALFRAIGTTRLEWSDQVGTTRDLFLTAAQAVIDALAQPLAEAIADIAIDADVDAREARLALDPERAQYLRGERHGLMEARKLVIDHLGVAVPGIPGGPWVRSGDTQGGAE